MLKLFSLGVFLSILRLSHAVNVYLNPKPESLRPILGVDDASAIISHHVGLEMLESVPEAMRASYEQTKFVAQGHKSALVVTLNEADAERMYSNLCSQHVPKSSHRRPTIRNEPFLQAADSILGIC